MPISTAYRGPNISPTGALRHRHRHDRRLSVDEAGRSNPGCLRNATFRVEVVGGHLVLAHISGKIRRNHFRIMPLDRVLLELSPYDLDRGRILFRYRT